MSWIRDIFGGVQNREASQAATPSKQDKESDNTGSYKDNEVRINRPEQSLTVSAVYRAVEPRVLAFSSTAR